MSSSFRRNLVAAGLLVFGASQVVSAQVSLGIGSTAQREAEARILRQLEGRDSFDFQATPLEDFAEALRARFGINVHIDQRALDDMAIDTAIPVSVHLREATLESCLNLTLEALDLTWTIRHETLVITSPEEAEYELDTRVYPVRDLVLIEYEHTVDADFDSLMYMITSAIQPDSWDDVGGPGAIEPNLVSLSLVISQTWQTHRQIERLLTTLREARNKQGIAPVKPESQSTPPARPSRHYRPISSVWPHPRVYDN